MRKKKFFKVLAWPLGIIILYGALRDFLYDKVALPVWDYLGISEGVWLDISVSLAAMVCLVFGWKSKRKKYSASAIGLFLSVVSLVLLLYFDNTETPFLFCFNKTPCWFVLLLSYIAGIIVHILYSHLKPFFKTKKKVEDLPVVELFQDKPISKINEDKLSYNSLAKRIASAIINNSSEKSFSIGITGTWGAGKTTMLQFIKQLIEERDDIIVIEFSPRQSATLHDIQKDFLSQLAESLSKYHSGAQRVSQKYMRSIGALPDNLWAARLLGSVSEIRMSQRKENISDIIEEIGKKIVVLVDDFDRLSGEEIQEVLKLIDKNAAFSNTFFVTAYDKEQANLVISSSLGIKDDEKDTTLDYTDKYFNLEVSLPIRRQSNYVRVLRECLYSLSDKGVIGAKRKDIDEALPKLYRYLPQCLPNIRDVKRFSNLVSITLPLVENDVLLSDYLLVSLIRYKYPEEYEKLGRYTYVVRLGSALTKKKYYELETVNLNNVKSKEMLKSLFPGSEAHYKSIAHINSFANYFYDVDSGHLLYKDLSELLEPHITPEAFESKVNELIKDDVQKSDFVEFILSNENNCKNTNDALRFFRLFLLARTYCDSRDLYIATLSYLLKDNLSENIKQFGITDESSYVGLLKDVLNEKFDFRLSIESLHDALHSITTLGAEDMSQLVFSYDELLSFARKKVEIAVLERQKGNVTPNDVYRALKACVIEYNPDTSEEMLDSEAIGKVRDAIKLDPEVFLNDFLSHKRDMKRKAAIIFYIQDKIPYTDIFKSIEDFAAFVGEISKEKNNSVFLCLSQFADLCTAQKTWTPSLAIKGNISSIKQHDYEMYNKLFEGEAVEA